MVTNDYPKLSAHVESYPFDEDTYLLQQKLYNHQIRVGQLTYHVLMCCTGDRDIGQISRDVQAKTAYPLSTEEVTTILTNQKILSLGFLEGNQPIRTQPRNEYLKLRMILLRREWLRYPSILFKRAFNPSFFYASGSILLIGLLMSLWAFRDRLDVTDHLGWSELLMCYGCLLLSTFFHEMGHVSACRQFNADHGGIGFGFYLFMPVFFADVSDAWKLRPSQRIIIDLAGIYMELWYCAGLVILYLLTGISFFLCGAVFVLLHTSVNLNPLLRYDGYWALSDWLNRPNLRANADQMVAKLWAWLRGKTASPITDYATGLLLFYGLLNRLFLIVFVATVLIGSPFSVLYYPLNLYDFGYQLISRPVLPDPAWLSLHGLPLVVPTFFYILLCRLILVRFRR